MKKLFVAAAAATLALGLAVGASAQKLDANGKCHDAAGKFAKMSVCKAGAKADAKETKADAKADKKVADAKADATKTKADAKADATKSKADANVKAAKTRCKNAKGKFAKCGTAGATPVT